MFGGEGERGMKAGVGGGGLQKYTPHPVLQWRDFSQSQEFFVDDDSRLSATGSIR